MGVNGIYGLSGSGIDIESMVKVGMMSKQKEYDKMAQKYTKNEWTKAEYLKLNSSLNTFNMSTLSQYKMSANMNAKTAESDSSAVKVTANASAPVMSHKVQVDELSSNVYLLGVDKVTRKNTEAPTSIKLADAIFKPTTAYDDSGQPYTASMIEFDDESVEVSFGGVGGSTFRRTFNKSDVAIKFTLTDGTQETNNSAYTISYTYGELFGGVTFNDLVSKINSLDSNVKATYDSVQDRFSFYNKEGGKNNKVVFTLDAVTGATENYGDNQTSVESLAALNARDFLNGLHLMESRDGTLYSGRQSSSTWSYNTSTGFFTDPATGNIYDTATGKYYEDATKDTEISAPITGNAPSAITMTVGGSKTIAGTNGSITVDGITYETTDNKATVNGIIYSATAKTSAATVTVTQDVDAIVEKVKSFVTDYDKLLASLYDKYDEKPETGYTPLTQSQKDSMKEEQIEKWEEKAKKGMLYHDKTIGKIISEMREAINTPIEGIEGKYNSAYSIGISTTGLKGQLVVDETKLRAALADDPDAVYNVFAKLDNSNTDKKGNVINNPEGNGIAQRLGDVLTTATKNIKSRAGSSEAVTEDSDLNTLMRQLQTKMSNFKKLMSSFENTLYKKYDKMESTLAALGTQLNFIAGGNQ